MTAPSTDFNQARPQGIAWTPGPNDMVLSEALAYARRGWAIIPVNPFTKVPFLKDWQHLGSKDEEQVREWWREWPNAMIGALTGPASGFWVLDIDVDLDKTPPVDGADVLRGWYREHGPLPITISADTPRGGQHFYFAHHDGVRNKAGRKEMRGVDWRGDGGFIILPPSVKADRKTYAWKHEPEWTDLAPAPDWLLDIVLKKPSIAERAQAAVVPPATWTNGRGYGAAALDAECRELSATLSGSRNDQLNRSAFSLAQLVAGGELGEVEVKSALMDAAGACGLVQDDGRPSVEKTIWSGFNAGLQFPRRAPERAQDGHSGGGGANTLAEEVQNRHGTPERPAEPIRLRATPFVWRDPASFPRRRWLYGFDYARRYLSALIAPGGTGKSSLLIVEALAMATGRDLLGVKPRERVNVWLWNGEDPREETERRIVAAMKHFGIVPEEVENRLFVDSGRDTPIVIATSGKDGVRIAAPVVDALVSTMKEREIGALFVDPFISSHRVNENANGEVDAVAKQWGVVAERTNAAIGLAHHARKPGGAEVTTETSRGASALMDAVRMGRAINRMTPKEAEEAGVESPHLYFRTGGADPGKQNLAPPPEKARWYRLVSVPLGNGRQGGNAFSDFNRDADDDGDHVAVVTAWEWPSCLSEVQVADLEEVQRRVAAGRYREHYSSPDYVGRAVADVCNLDMTSDGHRRRVRKMLTTWYASGALEVYEAKDENDEWRKFVRVGTGERP